MESGHIEEELLHVHFDGELPPDQSGQVDRHLAQCDSCRARQRSLARLRALIVASARDDSRGVDFEAAFTNIQRGVRERPQPALRERVAVSVQDLREQRPHRLWLGAAAAGLAAAAAALLALRGPQTEEPTARAPTAPPGVTTAPETARAPKKTERIAYAAVSSEIEQVDFGGKPGTVFEIALADGVSTPVVWINDDVQE